jgi:hypothetical protein
MPCHLMLMLTSNPPMHAVAGFIILVALCTGLLQARRAYPVAPACMSSEIPIKPPARVAHLNVRRGRVRGTCSCCLVLASKQAVC